MERDKLEVTRYALRYRPSRAFRIVSTAESYSFDEVVEERTDIRLRALRQTKRDEGRVELMACGGSKRRVAK